jgi:hypothetical protein
MNLETLELTAEELKLAREQVRHMAYRKWQEAGCPPGDPLSFWKDAELEWIEYEYVPDRTLMERVGA